MRNIFLASCIMAFGLVFTACAPSEPINGTSSSTKMTDSELETKIKSKFDSDAQLKGADLKVSADAEKNEATISGTVATQALRIKAVTLAKESNSGLVLTDKIDVEPGELKRADYTEENAREAREKAKGSGDTIGDSVDDAWIHTKIVTQLIGNSDTPQRKINVDVVKNVVTLRGTVDAPEQKTEAERVARETEGVTKVVNQLKVGAK